MSVTSEAWDAMSAEPSPQVGVLRRRILAGQPRDVFVGITQPDQRRVLILAFETRALGDSVAPSGTRAVSCSLHHVNDDRSEFHLTLEVNDISDVFSTFADDVALAISHQPDDRSAVLTLLDRFEVWRELLSGRNNIGMTGGDAQGLWAELWVMEHFLSIAWEVGPASCWTAGDGDDKDFRHGALSIEVKSTSRKAPVTVDISNEYQLHTDPDEVLLLAVVELTSSASGAGETLPERVQACRTALGRADASVMTERLIGRGYDEETVTRTRYLLRACTWYRVEEGFPSIVAADIANGVGNVTYRVSLDACQPWRIDGDEVMTSLRTPPLRTHRS